MGGSRNNTRPRQHALSSEAGDGSDSNGSGKDGGASTAAAATAVAATAVAATAAMAATASNRSAVAGLLDAMAVLAGHLIGRAGEEFEEPLHHK